MFNVITLASKCTTTAITTMTTLTPFKLNKTAKGLMAGFDSHFASISVKEGYQVTRGLSVGRNAQHFDWLAQHRGLLIGSHVYCRRFLIG